MKIFEQRSKEDPNTEQLISSYDLSKELGMKNQSMKKKIETQKKRLEKLNYDVPLYFTDDRKGEGSAESIGGKNPQIYWLTPRQALWLTARCNPSEDNLDVKVFVKLEEIIFTQKSKVKERKNRNAGYNKKYGR